MESTSDISEGNISSSEKECNVPKSLSTLVDEGIILFPYKSITYPNAEPFFNNLLGYKYTISNNSYTPIGSTMKTLLFPFTYLNKYTYFRYNKDDYEDIDIITDLYTENQRVRASVSNKGQIQPSPYAYFRDNVLNIISDVMKSGQTVTPATLREQIYKSTKEANQFKVTLAYSVYKFFKAKSVLDFSAGWGDRLIAAIGAKVSYTGYDPNIDLQSGHGKIIEELCPLAGVDNGAYQVTYLPFEEAELDRKFDLVFTSPPFFNLEVYTDASNQSINTHPKFKDWLVNWLFVVVAKAWNSLISGGHLVLHLADFGGYNIVEPLNLYLQTLSKARYMGVIGTEGASGRIIPMWVWKHDVDNSARAASAKGYLDAILNKL